MSGRPGSKRRLWKKALVGSLAPLLEADPYPGGVGRPRPGQTGDRDWGMPWWRWRLSRPGVGGELTQLLPPPVVEDQRNGQESHEQDQGQQDTQERPLEGTPWAWPHHSAQDLAFAIHADLGEVAVQAQPADPSHVCGEGPAELPTSRGAPSWPSGRVGGRGQMTTSPRSSCWQLWPPTVTFTSTQSATAPRPMYCGDSVRPGRSLSLGQASAPPSAIPPPPPHSPRT